MRRVSPGRRKLKDYKIIKTNIILVIGEDGGGEKAALEAKRELFSG